MADVTARLPAAKVPSSAASQSTLTRRGMPWLSIAMLASASGGKSSAGVELGLSGEDDLEDLLARRLQVGEEPELLEHVRAQVLGLVDEERDVAARLRVLEQELVEALEEDELATAFRRHAELEQDVLEDLVEADRGVQEQDRLGRGPDRVEQATQQRRLPGAGVADQRDEALARLDPVAEGGQRLLVAVVEVEEAWVGGDVEGGFAKPEVLGVHGR